MYLFIYYLKITSLETELETLCKQRKEFINNNLKADLKDRRGFENIVLSLDKEIERIEKKLNKLQIEGI